MLPERNLISPGLERCSTGLWLEEMLCDKENGTNPNPGTDPDQEDHLGHVLPTVASSIRAPEQPTAPGSQTVGVQADQQQLL